jgi:hypothetical protein
MSTLIVVDDPDDWGGGADGIPGVAVVPARSYLTDPAYGEDRAARVFNLCRSYRYQSFGYYISLLAEARGPPPPPRARPAGAPRRAPTGRGRAPARWRTCSRRRWCRSSPRTSHP